MLYDKVLHALDISTSFAGLSAPTTIAHIHCCLATPGTGTAAVAVTPGTLPGFPTGLTSGSFSVQVDLTQAAAYTGSFLAGAGGGTLAGAEAAPVAAMNPCRAYFNIHTSAFPNGEIRAFIAPIPEPSTYALMALGLATLVGRRRWRAWQEQRLSARHAAQRARARGTQHSAPERAAGRTARPRPSISRAGTSPAATR